MMAFSAAKSISKQKSIFLSMSSCFPIVHCVLASINMVMMIFFQIGTVTLSPRPPAVVFDGLSDLAALDVTAVGILLMRPLVGWA